MGSRDSGNPKVDPHWVQGPPWSFNGPCHGPTIHPTWPGLECEMHIPFYEHFWYKNIDGAIKKMF